MSSVGQGPLVQPGDVVRIPEADYLYGAGVLTMRVTAVGADLAKFPALEWVALKGVEIRWDGGDGGERQVMVRVSALRQYPPMREPVIDRSPLNDDADAG